MVQTGAEIEHTSQDTYFCGVYTLIQQVKDLILTKGEQAICNNLYTCFWGIALQWFTSELPTNSKILVKYGPEIEQWERRVFKQFKVIPSLAMAIVVSKKYDSIRS